MFLAVRELRRTWRRFLLIGMVVGLVATLSTVLTGLAHGLVTDGISGLRALPLTHLSFSPGADATFSRSTLGPSAERGWREQPGVEATPIGVSFVNASSTAGGPSIDLALFGVESDSFLFEHGHSGETSAQGREQGRDLDGLVLSQELEEEGVKVGDLYRIEGTGTALRVVGFTFGGSYGHVPIAYTDLSTWERAVYGNDVKGRFSALALRLPGGFDVAAVDRKLDTETLTKKQAYGGSPGYSAETATMTLIRGFLLVISALIVGAFFTVLTVQRTRQIGLLKAMGASSFYVLRDGIGQIAVVVVLSSFAGAAAGAAIIALVSRGDVPIELSVSGVLTSALLLVVTGIVGSFSALRRITGVEPAIALGVER